MKCRLSGLSALIAAITVPLSRAEDAPPLKKEAVHALVREVAAKIEARFKGVHPEADGLLQRVEEALTTPEPPTSDNDDRQARLAKKLRLMDDEAGFQSMIGGVHGAVFDNSDTGFMQRYQDLESASTKDAAEVWRWLEMADAARRLKWRDKAEIGTQRALGAARALVTREPKNAEAHALLGVALEWSGEKLTALQTALKLDPKQPLALNEMLDRRIDQALENAVLRHASSLEEKTKKTQELEQALFDRPLTDEETLAFERQHEELRRELMQLLTLAQERNDLPVYLKTVNLLTQLRTHRDKVALAAKRHRDESFEAFQTRLREMMATASFTVFADDAILQAALKLAETDAEATGTIMLMALIGDSASAQRDHQRPKGLRMEIIGKTFARLCEMANADDSLQAARAAEAAFIMEFGMALALGREPTRLDLLLIAVRLDPFRQRTQHMVMGLCAGMLSKAKDPGAAAALTLTELALLPSLQTRRTCAAAAAVLNDWPSAHRHLDACLKEKPEDLGLLNQKLATLLRESQSRAAQKKAETYFHKIESLREKQATEENKADLKLITRNHILFLIICGKNDAAREQLAVVKRDQLLDGTECQELEDMLP